MDDIADHPTYRLVEAVGALLHALRDGPPPDVVELGLLAACGCEPAIARLAAVAVLAKCGHVWQAQARSHRQLAAAALAVLHSS